MKLLVFAHTPPPLHGQSYMVQLMLAGFGGNRAAGKGQPAANPVDYGIECYHVNTCLSKRIEDIGEFHGSKLLRLFFYCVLAIGYRFRYGVTNFYYIPAPGKRSALYRDWMVMLLCRPFFKKMIFHWHAAGLAKWLETSAQIRTRALTYRFMKQVDLSIVLSNYNRLDADKFFSRRVCIVADGIPDPCPDFEATILPRRRQRLEERKKLQSGDFAAGSRQGPGEGGFHQFNVLFLAHCTRGKGLFDAIDGVALANRHLAELKTPIRIHLTVAGEFMSALEKQEFQQRIQQPDLQVASQQSCVRYLGFVTGEAKHRAFAESDCFCFPTHYYAESFGLVVLEAMAFGLPVIASRWRSIPELLPPNYPGIVPPRAPDEIAKALVQMITATSSETLRKHFLQHFTLEQHFLALAKALHTVEKPLENHTWVSAPQPS